MMKLFMMLFLPLSVFAQNAQMIQNVQKTLQEISNAGNPPQYRTCGEIINDNYGQDPKYTVSLKNYPRPSKGCLPINSITDQEASALISSQNFTTQNATLRERKVLAAAIKRVQELNGGVLTQGVGWNVNQGRDPYPWIYFQNGEYSEMSAQRIMISRKVHRRGNENHYGHSVAQHVHEWAHLIGNKGVYTEFQKYMNSNNYSSQDYCMISNYADNTNGEQFAEVFTAFVTEPSILLNNSRTPKNCEKVFKFFWDFFKQGHKVQDCL